jgi:leucine dehydrogenase
VRLHTHHLHIDGYETVLAFADPSTGLRGFVALHSTRRGPAMGGIRYWPYSCAGDALADALRLSRAMTYKAALAELRAGGGKAVVIGHPQIRREEAFGEFGRLVAALGGRFFTGPDAGVTDDDLRAARRVCGYVVCHDSPELGDLNQATALGVWAGMRACLEFAGIAGRHVAIQGVGGVGMALAAILHREGFKLTVADVEASRAEQARREFGAAVAAPEPVMETPCDVLAPCALGGVITDAAVPRLRARIVCGSANNQLASAAAGDRLAARGVLFAPDYLVNAGALIRGAEFFLEAKPDSRASIERIYQRTLAVLERARAERTSPPRVADRLAEERLAV